MSAERLETLRSMVLAAAAAGDTELAGWLAERADDPAALAELTGGAETVTGVDDAPAGDP